MHRVLSIAVLVAACGQPESVEAPAAPAPRPVVVPAADAGVAAVVAPPFRLPDGVVPTAYDLTLEIDPDAETFHGRVAIDVEVAAPVTRIWLHANELELASAALVAGGKREAVVIEPVRGASQVRGFVLPHPVGNATVTLAIEYAGQVATLGAPSGKEDEEGLFREQLHGRWYVFSQAESIFARRIVPCFDEPRWKPQWKVAVVAPAGQVVLANGAASGETAVGVDRKETRFAEVGPMASYVFAVAVGPFELAEVGKLGRGKLPVRVAVPRGEGARTLQTVKGLPAIVGALESYMDAPLPLAKLDLVAVPQFFGAMENPGLITFDRDTLVYGRDFTEIAAHELAHQWFGNAVTPVWWEHVWLSEAFATWLGTRVEGTLADRPGPLALHRERVKALRADDDVEAKPLVHPVGSSDEVEPAFDAIAYEKGGSLLATFEQFVGSDGFREAVRGYVRAHAGTAVPTRAFLDQLAAHTSHEIAAALESELAHAGTPVVDLELRCEPSPVVIAAGRGGVTVPVCVRYPGLKTPDCFLAGAAVEHPLASCPKWLVGNDGGRGYYQVAWRGTPPLAPLGQLQPGEELARGDDAAFALRRGDVPIAAALDELALLATSKDLYGELAAITIARTIDRVVDDTERKAWAGWLAARFPGRIRATRAIAFADYVMRAQLVDLAADEFGSDAVNAARALADRDPGRPIDPSALRLATVRDPDPLFAKILAAARATKQPDLRDELFEELGNFPGRFAPRLAELIAGGEPRALPALETMFARSDARTEAWRATHHQLGAMLDKLSAGDARRVLEATELVCDADQRAEIAADFTPRAATLPGGPTVLAHTLAVIDRCIARRAKAGDIAAALTPRP